MTDISYRTIDLDSLAMLPVYVESKDNYVDDSHGSACHGQPPGHPSYFVQNIYTLGGDTPKRGASLVIWNPQTESYHVVQNVNYGWGELQVKRETIYDAIYIPLPEDDVRNTSEGDWTHLFDEQPQTEQECNRQLAIVYGKKRNKIWNHPVARKHSCQHCERGEA